ncbi:myeloid cell surface antigen CD33-like isoform X1 [Notamacropus eugenii]|uniref:myeloid cell surface antigen CD33-like isoform X1 n=1 Tax=Notamacropus eugenii TaxID=9315 RepID=UPI003B682001
MDLWFQILSLFSRGYDIHVQDTVTVQEGLCVSIPCSFQYPQEYTNNNTTYGYWFQGRGNNTLVATNDPQRKVQPGAQSRFHLIGDLQKDNCSLSITGVQKKDHGNYWFHMEKGHLRHSYLHKNVSVQVEDLTETPEIFIPDLLESRDQVTLTCIAPGDCREGMAPNFLWIGSALSSQAFVSQDLNSSHLLFTPRAQDHGTNLTCQVTFPEARVSTETTVQLRVACECWEGLVTMPRYPRRRGKGEMTGAGICPWVWRQWEQVESMEVNHWVSHVSVPSTGTEVPSVIPSLRVEFGMSARHVFSQDKNLSVSQRHGAGKLGGGKGREKGGLEQRRDRSSSPIFCSLNKPRIQGNLSSLLPPEGKSFPPGYGVNHSP